MYAQRFFSATHKEDCYVWAVCSHGGGVTVCDVNVLTLAVVAECRWCKLWRKLLRVYSKLKMTPLPY